MASYEDIVRMMKEGKIKKKDKPRTKFGNDPYAAQRGKKSERPLASPTIVARQQRINKAREEKRKAELRQRRAAIAATMAEAKAEERRKAAKAADKARQQKERERRAMQDTFEDSENDGDYGQYDELQLRF